MRPGPHPMRELVREALRGADRDRDRVAELLERVVFDEPDESRVILVVDQFEEVWTACTDTAEIGRVLLGRSRRGSTSTSRCAPLFSACAPTMSSGLGRPAGACPGARRGRAVLVGTPTAAEVRGRSSIQPVADSSRCRCPTRWSTMPGTNPALCLCCLLRSPELWDQRDRRRLTLEGYAESGGLRGAVARIAERAYGELDESDRMAAGCCCSGWPGPEMATR